MPAPSFSLPFPFPALFRLFSAQPSVPPDDPNKSETSTPNAARAQPTSPIEKASAKAPPPPTIVKQLKEHEVEGIYDSRYNRRRKRFEYLVGWVKFDRCTWEPPSHLENAAWTVSIYHACYPYKPHPPRTFDPWTYEPKHEVLSFDEPCYLLQLPPELRLEIYALAFDECRISYWRYLDMPPLLSTCKAIRAEAVQTFQLRLGKSLALYRDEEWYWEYNKDDYWITAEDLQKRQRERAAHFETTSKRVQRVIRGWEKEGLVVMSFEAMMKRARA